MILDPAISAVDKLLKLLRGEQAFGAIVPSAQDGLVVAVKMFGPAPWTLGVLGLGLAGTLGGAFYLARRARAPRARRLPRTRASRHLRAAR